VSSQVLSNGPRRAAFRLTYTPWNAGELGDVQETKQFTVDCGVNFDAVERTFDFTPDTATVGIGITEHAQVAGFPAGVLTKDPGGRWMSWWEENKDGGLGIAVILAGGTDAVGFAYEPPAKAPGNGNNLLLVKARDGVPLRYFTGAGWNRSGQFADRAAWEAYVQAFAATVANPLTLSVAKP
jgi:pectinesterase